MSAITKVGLIGVGRMGLGLATNLLKAGFRLSYLNHPGNQPTNRLQDQGATPLTTPMEVAESAEAILLCVTGSPEVEAVVTGDRGLLRGLVVGKVVIDCSTAIPSATLAIADQVAATGAAFLDSPMTRTPKEAMEGRLNLIVGGEATVLERVRPILQSFAENIVHAGPIGRGHQLKLLHNYVSLGFAAILTECAAAAHKGGIDPQVLIDVLDQGGGKSVVLDRMAPFITDGEDFGFRFSVANAAKDLGYYLQMTQDLSAANGVAESVAALYRQALEDGDVETLVPHMIDQLKA